MNDRLSEHVGYVDGLRAVAVLAVIVFHSSLSNGIVANAPAPWTLLLKQGCHGVDLFFVVSGFCLAYPVLRALYASGRGDFDFCRYMAKRIVRIMPPYYAALALVVASFFVLKAIHGPLPPAMGILHAFDAQNILGQALFFDGGSYFSNASFWSLAVEFRWYFAFPALIWLWSRSPKAFVLTLVALVLFREYTRFNSVDVGTMPAFMLGIAAAHLKLRPYRWLRYAPIVALIAFVVTLSQTPLDEWVGFMTTSTEIGAFALFICAENLAGLRRILSSAPMQFIGTRSYGIYLVHEPIVGFVNVTFAHAGFPQLVIPLAIGAGVAGGIAFSQCFEQPFLHGRLRRSSVESLERVMRTLWRGMPGENPIALRWVTAPPTLPPLPEVPELTALVHQGAAASEP